VAIPVFLPLFPTRTRKSSAQPTDAGHEQTGSGLTVQNAEDQPERRRAVANAGNGASVAPENCAIRACIRSWMRLSEMEMPWAANRP